MGVESIIGDESSYKNGPFLGGFEIDAGFLEEKYRGLYL
jgi:hypothetical protein